MSLKVETPVFLGIVVIKKKSGLLKKCLLVSKSNCISTYVCMYIFNYILYKKKCPGNITVTNCISNTVNIMKLNYKNYEI